MFRFNLWNINFTSALRKVLHVIILGVYVALFYVMCMCFVWFSFVYSMRVDVGCNCCYLLEYNSISVNIIFQQVSAINPNRFSLFSTYKHRTTSFWSWRWFLTFSFRSNACKHETFPIEFVGSIFEMIYLILG